MSLTGEQIRNINIGFDKLYNEEECNFDELKKEVFSLFETHIEKERITKMIKKHPIFANYMSNFTYYTDVIYELLMYDKRMLSIFTNETISKFVLKCEYSKIAILTDKYKDLFIKKITDIDALTHLEKMADPYRGPSYKRDQRGYLAFSITNLDKEYQRRLLMTSLIGYLYRMWDEHEFDYTYKLFNLLDDPEFKAKKYSEDLLKSGSIDPNNVENRVSVEDKREIIQNFLDAHLRYNPDIHVSEATIPTRDEPDIQVKINTIFKNAEDEEVNYPIPAADTFARWERYQDNHYEQLRLLTDAVYAIKPNFEYVIHPYDIFSTSQKAKDFRSKYEKELANTIKLVEVGHPTFLEAWRENREVVDAGNRNTRVLDAMLEETSKADKLMAEMTKKRKEVLKKKEVLKLGPDDKFVYNTPGADKNKESYGKDNAVEITNEEGDVQKPMSERQIVYSSSDGPHKKARAKKEAQQKLKEQLKEKESVKGKDADENIVEINTGDGVVNKFSVDQDGGNYERETYRNFDKDFPDDQGEGDEDMTEIRIIELKSDKKTKTGQTRFKKMFVEAESAEMVGSGKKSQEKE